jgi:hypothetical protein
MSSIWTPERDPTQAHDINMMKKLIRYDKAHQPIPFSINGNKHGKNMYHLI